MTASAISAMWFLPFVAPICLWVAYSDLSTMKIPNKAVLALIIGFLVAGLLALPFPEYWPRLINFGVVLLIGFLMTMTGLVGAGDAKFAAAMALFIARGDVPFILMLFGLTAIVSIAAHRLAKITPLRKLAPNWESWERTKDFPMGVPLAATLLIYLIFVFKG
jgi:prepilin peptidase CpaA